MQVESTSLSHRSLGVRLDYYSDILAIFLACYIAATSVQRCQTQDGTEDFISIRTCVSKLNKEIKNKSHQLREHTVP